MNGTATVVRAVGTSPADLRRVRADLAMLVDGFDASVLSGSDAAACVQVACEIERLAGAVKLLAAARVDETRAWSDDGSSSAARWLATKAGTSVGDAGRTIDTAKQLKALPATAKRVRAGRLSAAQTKEIAEAATADPQAETGLLQVAAKSSVNELRRRCRDVRAAARPENADETYRRIRAARCLRRWIDDEGAYNVAGRSTVDDGALVDSVLDPIQQRLFKEAWAAGRREPVDAYWWDALVEAMRIAGLVRDEDEMLDVLEILDERAEAADGGDIADRDDEAEVNEVDGADGSRGDTGDIEDARDENSDGGANESGENSEEDAAERDAKYQLRRDAVTRPADGDGSPITTADLLIAAAKDKARRSSQSSSTPSARPTAAESLWPEPTEAEHRGTVADHTTSPPTEGGTTADRIIADLKAKARRRADSGPPADRPEARGPVVGPIEARGPAAGPTEASAPIRCEGRSGRLFESDPYEMYPGTSHASGPPDRPDLAFPEAVPSEWSGCGPGRNHGRAVTHGPGDAQQQKKKKSRRRPVTLGSRMKIIGRLDLDALVRGHAEPGEVCEIQGYGPVPVAILVGLLPEAFVAAIVTRGQDVTTVAHVGRQATAFQRTALDWTENGCSTEGCPNLSHREIDHTLEWSRSHHTKLGELLRPCQDCHRKRTYEGYRYGSRNPVTGKTPLFAPKGDARSSPS